MEYKGNYWLTNSTMAKYQSMLCENPHIWLEVLILNPATLLLIDLSPLEHECIEIMGEVFLRWPDITDQSIGNPDVEYFTVAAALSKMAHALLVMQW
jgi:hypothetical protein